MPPIPSSSSPGFTLVLGSHSEGSFFFFGSGGVCTWLHDGSQNSGKSHAISPSHLPFILAANPFDFVLKQETKSFPFWICDQFRPDKTGLARATLPDDLVSPGQKYRGLLVLLQGMVLSGRIWSRPGDSLG